MTEIAFHFNAPDKVAYACRLLRKVLASGARAVVVADPARLSPLDEQLWTFGQLDFVAHCRWPAQASMAAASPVILAETVSGDLPHHDVLVNLGDRVPDGFERFARLIEVVSLDETDRQGARSRWKHYAARGYAIVRHDLALRS